MIDQAALARLLRLIAGGDKGALSTFYKLSSRTVFRRINAILGDHAAAEDTLQDVYIAVWRYARTFDPASGSPMKWLGSIARNQALALIRARGTRLSEGNATAVESLMDPSPSPLEKTVAGAEVRALKNCLDGLDLAAQRALLLAFYGGRSYVEVARLLGEPEGTVKSRIRRGLPSSSCASTDEERFG